MSISLFPYGATWHFILGDDTFTQEGYYYPVTRYKVIDLVTEETIQIGGKRFFGTAEEALRVAASHRGSQTRMAVVSVQMYVCDSIKHTET